MLIASKATAMQPEFDLVVRGGTVFDGLGAEGRDADIAVRDGKVAAVGKFAGAGRDEIDARGRIVAPGFVDIHTHYDGQATWTSQLSPSSWHGVTTAVMGNCGVGFAPCHPDDHAELIRLMEGVEDIPAPVLAEGLKWNWVSFPDYLDAVEAIPHDVDVAAQLPHAALRVYAMGERGANREPATQGDIALMSRLAEQAIDAGALGFTTSRTLNHRSSDGRKTPTLTAEREELVGIANGVGRAGQGVLQVISDLFDRADEFTTFRRMARESGRPLSISLVQTEMDPGAWRDVLGEVERANAEGLTMRAQVCGRPVGMLFGLELTHNPFSAHALWEQIADLPLAAKLARLRDPLFRASLLAARPEGRGPFAKTYFVTFDKMFVLGDPPNYEPLPDNSIGAQARRRGVAPALLALEQMESGGGKGLIYYPLANYAEGWLEPSLEMMKHPNTVMGLSDGGAHVGTICDGSFPTTMLTHWTRDRTRGPKLPLPWAIRAYTSEPARAVGLRDRGVLRPGYRADINIIDYDRLSLRPPEVTFDLPAGGRRLLQRAEGYETTIVAGHVTYRKGQATGALPGRLIRGEQPAPQ
jgi:N-acyl-D-aspartate/D-glutamate deacylase